MSIVQIGKLFVSRHDGWDQVAHVHASVIKLFALLVVPLSLIPPLMLEYAGHHYGSLLYPTTPAQSWSIAALVFLVAELLTVPLMAWAIQSVAKSRGLASGYHDAFTLSSISAIPLWLSSLVLFSSNIVLIVGILGLGLIGSVLLIFRGVEGILGMDDDVVAFDLAYIVTAMGLIAWVVLIMLGLVPAIS
jgi:Yip1 domain